ncbi:hypothetical protein [Gymnodinialimonas sp.]
MRQLSDEFLECARRRLQTESSLKQEGELRRATSDLYFALFHGVCAALVEQIEFDEESSTFRDVFMAIYRQVDHGRLEKNARRVGQNDPKFSEPFASFSKQITAMKNKREKADYDPLAQLKLSTVTSDLQTVETTLDRFWSAPELDRARFAVFVAVRR